MECSRRRRNCRPIAFGAFSFEERCVERATLWNWAQDHALRTCSAEDLVVHKVFAGRPRDWGDVESVLIRQHGKLDFAQLRSELQPLLELKGQPDSMSKLEDLITIVDRRLLSPG